MTNDRVGVFSGNSNGGPDTPASFGEITASLLRFLESPQGGGMKHSDCVNLLSVADEFRTTSDIRDGLVQRTQRTALVGKVQSGKTTGMALTIAALADAGIECFIVLTGTKTNLTEQTTEELEEKFESKERTREWRWSFERANSQEGQLKNSIIRVIQKRNSLNPTRQLLVITCMKEDDYLRKLNRVLQDVVSSGVDISGRFVLFDDEGDQASPDNSNKKAVKSSTINRLLTEMTETLGDHIFVPVTATPQALLTQQRENTVRPEKAILLNPGSAYVGGQSLFCENRESFVRLIPSGDLSALSNQDIYPPDSLQLALATFLLTVALIRETGRKPIPVSMLVHPHQNLQPHVHTMDWIVLLLDGWLSQIQDSDDITDEACYEIFQNAALDLSSTSRARLEAANFDIAGQKLDVWIRKACSIIQSQDLQVRKTSGNDKFNRNEWEDSDAWIFVGGEVLGRGFVVRGLVTTYMQRDVSASNSYNVDTFQQRARFFGYKKSYSDLLRGWFPVSLSEKFQQYVEHEDYLWDFLLDQRAENRDLRYSRAIFEMAPNAKPSRASANRTGGRVSKISPVWIRQHLLYSKKLVTNIQEFTRWREKYSHLKESWTPPDFTSTGFFFDSWVVSSVEAVELLKKWEALSIDRAVLHAVVRRLETKPESKVRVIDMMSKTSPSGSEAVHSKRSVADTKYAGDPWGNSDFAQINQIHSNTKGQADADCFDNEMDMSIQIHNVEGLKKNLEGTGHIVGALAIRYTDPILKGIFGERE